jgi:hypothetical protein
MYIHRPLTREFYGHDSDDPSPLWIAAQEDYRELTKVCGSHSKDDRSSSGHGSMISSVSESPQLEDNRGAPRPIGFAYSYGDPDHSFAVQSQGYESPMDQSDTYLDFSSRQRIPTHRAKNKRHSFFLRRRNDETSSSSSSSSSSHRSMYLNRSPPFIRRLVPLDYREEDSNIGELASPVRDGTVRFHNNNNNNNDDSDSSIWSSAGYSGRNSIDEDDDDDEHEDGDEKDKIFLRIAIRFRAEAAQRTKSMISPRSQKRKDDNGSGSTVVVIPLSTSNNNNNNNNNNNEDVDTNGRGGSETNLHGGYDGADRIQRDLSVPTECSGRTTTTTTTTTTTKNTRRERLARLRRSVSERIRRATKPKQEPRATTPR